MHCYDLVTHSILRLQVTSRHFTFESFYLMGVDALVSVPVNLSLICARSRQRQQNANHSRWDMMQERWTIGVLT
ncbi:hypothetical protein I312_106600 [Cryptococcus bacillisporus CA1280]|uniref:uncharacterized protein n=1 Tax=Cryptococcus bacillisporus CA1280 TaxID=1296109 RepID=UPI00336978AE